MLVRETRRIGTRKEAAETDVACPIASEKSLRYFGGTLCHGYFAPL
jgi:hypothetical protein